MTYSSVDGDRVAKDKKRNYEAFGRSYTADAPGWEDAVVSFAILLTIYSQSMDNAIETDMTLFATTKLCYEQGTEIVNRKLAGRNRAGKPVRSVWFTCETVRGRQAKLQAARQ